MAHIETLTLRVSDPAAQVAFYRDMFGMSDLGAGRVGYSGAEAAIQFEQAQTPYAPQGSDLYWKIALSVPDIELAVAQLRARGVPCSDPRQFRDVGYLAHAADPEGFGIELLDHHFQGQRPAGLVLDETRLGGGAHLSLITLRCGNIADVEPALLRQGMSPLSVQDVSAFGFTLYFYAFTDERPPKPELSAVENRSWIYRRPYTVLEIQHVHDLDAETHPQPGAAGYGGVVLAEAPDFKPLPRLGLMPAD